MKTRCVVTLMVVGAFMLISQPAIADDLADLKAASQRAFQVWNTGDVDGIFDVWLEDGGIWLSATRAFPIPVIKNQMGVQFWHKWFQTHKILLSWYNPQYRVIGNTGLVWGHYSHLVINTATGKAEESYRKLAFVFVKSEGKWKMVLAQDALIPSERKVF